MSLPKCELCGETLNEKRAVWLELAEGTNDFYRAGIPAGAKSQGWFPFGRDCAAEVEKR